MNNLSVKCASLFVEPSLDWVGYVIRKCSPKSVTMYVSAPSLIPVTICDQLPRGQ